MSRGYCGLQKGAAVWIGDSITQGSGRASITVAQAIPALVSATKRFVPGINAGVSGQDAVQMLSRFESDVLAFGPSMISIGSGTNEPSHGIAVGAVGTAGSYMDAVAQMIVKGQRIGARVTLWIPIYAIDGTTNTSIAPFRTAMRALATTYGCDTFDLYNDIAALDSTTRNSYYVAGETPNGIHLSATGLAWAAGKVGSGAYANSFLSS
jgi:lysophospholipase L1-like esterase